MTDTSTGYTYQSRRQDVVARRQAGETLQSIADRYGLTRERVRQINLEAGGPTARDLKPLKDAQQKAEAARISADQESLHLDIRLAARASGPTTDAILARQFGVRASQVRAAVLGSVEEFLVAHEPGQVPTRFSDEAALDVLRELWHTHGPLSSKSYDALRGGRGISAIRAIQRFGSWASFVEAAGFNPPRKNTAPRADRYSEECLLAAAARCWAETGRLTNSSYEKWARENGQPSLTTVRKSFPSWRALKLAVAATLRDGGAL